MALSTVLEGNHLPPSLYQLSLVHAPDVLVVEDHPHLADLLSIRYFIDLKDGLSIDYLEQRDANSDGFLRDRLPPVVLH